MSTAPTVKDTDAQIVALNLKKDTAEITSMLFGGKDTPVYKTFNERQRNFLICLALCMGNISDACRQGGFNRSYPYDNSRDDRNITNAKDFRDMFTWVRDVWPIDFVQSQLFKQIKRGDTTAMIFFLKAKAGWVEKHEINHAHEITVNNPNNHKDDNSDSNNKSIHYNAIAAAAIKQAEGEVLSTKKLEG